MFKTVLLFTFLVGSAIADLKDFPDMDAFYIAQNNNMSFLEPPKEVYQMIAKELNEIRTSFPVVAHIHRIPYAELGKVICNKGIDLEKVNNTYGPIIVEDIGHNEHLVTFPKPYNEYLLLKILGLKDFAQHGQNSRECRTVSRVGAPTNIWRSDLSLLTGKTIDGDITYFFEEKSVGCFIYCRRTHTWTFTNKSGKFVLESDFVSDLDKRTTPA